MRPKYDASDAAQVVVYQVDGDGALTDSRGDAFHRPVPDVADREDAGQAGFQESWQAPPWPLLTRLSVVEKVGPGQHEARLVAPHGIRQPLGARLGADQYEQGHGGHGFGRTGR